jgi:hypothetical protein
MRLSGSLVLFAIPLVALMLFGITVAWEGDMPVDRMSTSSIR